MMMATTELGAPVRYRVTGASKIEGAAKIAGVQDVRVSIASRR
jgi:hypothetical protein